jgi:glycerophosphoryl diester phosphodiesterase
MKWIPVRYRDGSLPPRGEIAGPSLGVVRRHPRYVARVHAAGHQVHVWTVDRAADVDFVNQLGVDAIITNRPAEVRALLAS